MSTASFNTGFPKEEEREPLAFNAIEEDRHESRIEEALMSGVPITDTHDQVDAPQRSIQVDKTQYKTGFTAAPVMNPIIDRKLSEFASKVNIEPGKVTKFKISMKKAPVDKNLRDLDEQETERKSQPTKLFNKQTGGGASMPTHLQYGTMTAQARNMINQEQNMSLEPLEGKPIGKPKVAQEQFQWQVEEPGNYSEFKTGIAPGVQQKVASGAPIVIVD